MICSGKRSTQNCDNDQIDLLLSVYGWKKRFKSDLFHLDLKTETSDAIIASLLDGTLSKEYLETAGSLGIDEAFIR